MLLSISVSLSLSLLFIHARCLAVPHTLLISSTIDCKTASIVVVRRYLTNSSVDYLDGFLHDYVRVTGSCPLAVADATQIEVETCGAVCAASAKHPAECIAINFSPWYVALNGSIHSRFQCTACNESAQYVCSVRGHATRMPTEQLQGAAVNQVKGNLLNK